MREPHSEGKSEGWLEGGRSRSAKEVPSRKVRPASIRHVSHFFLLSSVALGVLAGQFILFSGNQLPEELRYPHHVAAGIIVITLLYMAVSDFMHRTLRIKLIAAFIMIASIPITFLAALDQRVAYQALTENTRRALLGAASQTASSIDSFITATLNTVRTESLVPVLTEFLSLPPEKRRGGKEEREAEGVLKAFQQRDNVYIIAYSLLDKKGKTVVSTSNLDMGLDHSDRDYFTIPMWTGLPYVSSFYVANAAGLPSVYFSCPVRDADSKVVGLLLARYSASVLQQIVFRETGRLGKGSYASLYDEYFIRLADGSAPQTLFESVARLDPEEESALRAEGRLPAGSQPESSSFLPALVSGLTHADEQPFFVARQHKGDLSDSLNAAVELTNQSWWLVFSIPQRDFLAIVKTQNRNAVLVLLSCLAVVLVAALVIVRKVAGPVNRLTAVAERVIAGDLSASAEIEIEDDIGRLASAFNAMTSRLRDVIGDLNERVEELQQAQVELSKSESKYRELIQSANSIILRMDTEGKITFFNEFAQKFFGYSEAEILGRNVVGTIVPEMDSAGYNLAAKMQDICSHPERYVSSSNENMRKNGERVWVTWTNKAITDDQGDLIELLCIGNDITERRQAEEARMGLVTAVEQATETIMITNAEGVIEYVNPAFERVTGYARSEAIGQTPQVLQSGKHDKAFYRRMWDILSRGEVWTGHFINRHKTGRLFEEEATISPVRNAQGRIVSYVAVKRDVTEEVTWEQQLRQAQKMEAIGTLAGGIAHDFNNILMAIFGYAEMAMYKTQEDSRVRHDLNQVLKACNRAKDLVGQILTFSRQSEKERRPVELTPIVKETLKLLRASLPSTIEMRHAIGLKAGEDRILADPTQIHQVLMNLCSNAADAMRETGGVLEVAVVEENLDENVSRRYPGLHSGPHVKLSVSDSGHGMDAEVMEHIFEPFYTTKSPGKGTGMGLAVVHGIVRNHGGAITVQSEPGRGSVFQILIPRLERAKAHEQQPIDEPLQHGDERVLLVDDEAVLAELGRQMLENLGYQVTTKTSSLEALELFREDPARFDLVITDMTMPQLTGAALARELLAIRPNLPIILCSGFSDLIDGEKAKSLGIREYIMKPFVLRSMADAIRKALDRGPSPGQ